MNKRSAGLLVFRRIGQELQVLLVHPGGPFWKNKDDGAWSIPKGEYKDEEDAFTAAKREFAEETGFQVDGEFAPLGEVRQPGGKYVTAWAVEHDIDVSRVKSNTFTIPWPPKSGTLREFPEVDRAEWFSLPAAEGKMLKGQREFLTRLAAHLDDARKRFAAPPNPLNMDDKTKTRPQDAQRVNVHEDYELRSWATRFGVTQEELKAAVAKVGPMADDIERELQVRK
jgi:predicted NUDIX family NTP pyrophosphohydrolase